MKFSLQNNIIFTILSLISIVQAAFCQSSVILLTLYSQLAYQMQILEERVISEEFKGTQFSSNEVVGWNSKNIKRCDATTIQEYTSGNVFGIFAKETPNLQKIYSNLPPHWSLSIRADILLFRSVDNEKVNIVLDGQTYGTYSKSKGDGFDVCDTSYWYNDQLYFFSKNITHTTPSLNLQFTSNFDDDNDDEGFGIKNLSVRIDTCHPTCASCSGPSINQCTSCPGKGLLMNGICNCPGMTIAHNYQCLNECPYGFQADPSNTYCIEAYCNPAKCSKCDDQTKYCTECRDGYVLFKKVCITSCPTYAPLNGKACQDPAMSTPYSKYLMYGLTSNNFGEAEISGLGLELTGFNQVTFGHCGGVQLLGGPFIGQKGSSIKRVFSNIAPHYQIRFGFQYYQIDSWDDEGLKVSVDSNIVEEIKQNVKNGSKDLCGSSSWKESAYTFSKTMTHTSSSLEIKIDANFNEDPFNESYGIRDIFVIADYCPPGCATCDQNQCLTCLEGYDKSGIKCVNTCADDEYSANKTCNKCDSSCKTCKENATLCTSCKSGTYLLNNQCLSKCPDNYFDNANESICSQCSKGNCPLCIPHNYSTSCKNCTGFKIISNKCKV